MEGGRGGGGWDVNSSTPHLFVFVFIGLFPLLYKWITIFPLRFALQDGLSMLWDLNEGKHLYTLDSQEGINALCFSPNRYWLCAAAGPTIKIWVSMCVCVCVCVLVVILERGSLYMNIPVCCLRVRVSDEGEWSELGNVEPVTYTGSVAQNGPPNIWILDNGKWR